MATVTQRMPETTDGGTAAVVVKGVRKVFGTGETAVEALRGVDIVVPKGEFLAVMGPSGSGKSTLLHLVGGLDRPTEGTIEVGGQDLASLSDDELTLLRRRRIGFVFQFFNLLPILSAAENVALPLMVDGVREKQAFERAAASLERVGIAGRSAHRPTELSGGEQQRVAIARALVAEPVLILADEPTGNLDSAAGEQVLDLLRNVVDEGAQTVLMVTHDPRGAATADRMIMLKDGRVAEDHELGRAASLAEVLSHLEELEG